MRDTKKKNLLILAVVIALALSVLVSILATTKIYAASVVIADDAGLLSDAEEKKLTDEIAEASETTGWNIALGTTMDTGGRSTMEYADDLYDDLFGINTDGIAIVIDMENRNYYISTSGSAIGTITDSRVESILDAGWDDMSSGDYADAFDAMLRRAVRYKVNEKPHLATGDFVVAGVVAAIVFFLMVGLTAGRYHLKWGTYKYDFHKLGKVNVRNRRDDLVNQFVTHHRIDSGSSGGRGGGSSTHISHSGGMHGGGGRHF